MRVLILSFLVGALVGLDTTGKWPLLLMPVVLFVRMALNARAGRLAANTYGTSRAALLESRSDPGAFFWRYFCRGAVIVDRRTVRVYASAR
jgi:hypothetical protein